MKPTGEERAELMRLIGEAHDAAQWVIAAQNRNLRQLRANNRKLASARRILADSNRMANRLRS